MILDENKLISLPVPEHSLPVVSENRGQKISIDGWVSKIDLQLSYIDLSFPSGIGFYETDTLDTFFDSSWYFLRFIDPHNTERLVDPELERNQMPVDVYVGGVEHADLHLFYARFISYFLHDIGVVSNAEPFAKLIPQGVVRSRTFRNRESGVYIHRNDVIGIVRSIY